MHRLSSVVFVLAVFATLSPQTLGSVTGFTDPTCATTNAANDDDVAFIQTKAKATKIGVDIEKDKSTSHAEYNSAHEVSNGDVNSSKFERASAAILAQEGMLDVGDNVSAMEIRENSSGSTNHSDAYLPHTRVVYVSRRRYVHHIYVSRRRYYHPYYHHSRVIIHHPYHHSVIYTHSSPLGTFVAIGIFACLCCVGLLVFVARSQVSMDDGDTVIVHDIDDRGYDRGGDVVVVQDDYRRDDVVVVQDDYYRGGDRGDIVVQDDYYRGDDRGYDRGYSRDDVVIEDRR